jgi:hypothetical protein
MLVVYYTLHNNGHQEIMCFNLLRWQAWNHVDIYILQGNICEILPNLTKNHMKISWRSWIYPTLVPAAESPSGSHTLVTPSPHGRISIGIHHIFHLPAVSTTDRATARSTATTSARPPDPICMLIIYILIYKGENMYLVHGLIYCVQALTSRINNGTRWEPAGGGVGRRRWEAETEKSKWIRRPVEGNHGTHILRPL